MRANNHKQHIKQWYFLFKEIFIVTELFVVIKAWKAIYKSTLLWTKADTVVDCIGQQCFKWILVYTFICLTWPLSDFRSLSKHGASRVAVNVTVVSDVDVGVMAFCPCFFSSHVIYFTRPSRRRRGSASWSGWCLHQIHTSWMSNVRIVWRFRWSSAMHKLP